MAIQAGDYTISHHKDGMTRITSDDPAITSVEPIETERFLDLTWHLLLKRGFPRRRRTVSTKDAAWWPVYLECAQRVASTRPKSRRR